MNGTGVRSLDLCPSECSHFRRPPAARERELRFISLKPFCPCCVGDKPTSEVPKGQVESRNRCSLLTVACALCGLPCSERGRKSRRSPGLQITPMGGPRPPRAAQQIQELTEQPPLPLRPPRFPLPTVVNLFIIITL